MTMTDLEFITKIIDDRAEMLIEANDAIHDFAELAFEEAKSAGVLTGILRREGFSVEEGLAGMPTCFTGTFSAGSGKPVMGILAEFDALDGLSQESCNPVHAPLKEGAPGHGCGHCSLGTGALAAAVAVKEYLKETGADGTVIYYGCPAEEGAGSKQFMARAGLFDICDFVYTWHPSATNDVSNTSTNAIMGANFEFFGKSAHAGGNPWAGRSGVDAAELMNIGTNYMHEHIEDGERIHYAYGDSGSTAPNVVPDYARVKYEVRSPKISNVKKLFDRVVKCAQGAALMTETTMKYQVTMAFSDSRNNSVLAGIASSCLKEVGAPAWTEEDYALAKRFLDAFDEENTATINEDLARRFGEENLDAIRERPLHDTVIEYDPARFEQVFGSSDVGDVTYSVPTCELHVACCALGTIFHTWQMAGQAGSPLAHKGLLTAGKAIALSCVRTMLRPDIIEKAKAETLKRNGGKYECPLPDDVMPPVGTY